VQAAIGQKQIDKLKPSPTYNQRRQNGGALRGHCPPLTFERGGTGVQVSFT